MHSTIAASPYNRAIQSMSAPMSRDALNTSVCVATVPQYNARHELFDRVEGRLCWLWILPATARFVK
eukprot:2350612-Rhodomonas_salina.1